MCFSLRMCMDKPIKNNYITMWLLCIEVILDLDLTEWNTIDLCDPEGVNVSHACQYIT